MPRCYNFHNFYESHGHAEGCAHMDENELRKHVLGAKKTERIIFAATPELKEALETVAQEKCMSLSALLTALATDEVLANKELFERKASNG